MRMKDKTSHFEFLYLLESGFFFGNLGGHVTYTQFQFSSQRPTLIMQFDSTLPQVDPFEALFKNTDLSKGVQAHVSRVYQTLLVMVATAAIGAVAQAKYQIGGFITFVGVFGTIIWLAFEPYRVNDAANEKKRTLLACLLAFFIGASLGPGLSYVYESQGDGCVQCYSISLNTSLIPRIF
jgi:hypothetical protein